VNAFRNTEAAAGRYRLLGLTPLSKPTER